MAKQGFAKTMKNFVAGKITGLAVVFFLIATLTGLGAESGRKWLHGHMLKVVSHLTPLGKLSATNQLSLAIGLPLRDPAGLDVFLQQLYDPRCPNFHHYLTPAEYTERFGPTESDYEAVKNFARTNGLTITATHDNRLLLDVKGSAVAVEKAFHVTLEIYKHPSEKRNFFAPDSEPSVDISLPIADVSGLNNYSRPHPNFHVRPTTAAAPRVGSGSGGTYFGSDFRATYAPGTTLTGAGQSVGLVQFDGFYSNDIASYAAAAGMTNIPIQTVLIDGFSGTPTTGSGSGNTEVSLDIEMAMAMAPGLSSIVVFEGNLNNFIPNDVLNQMAASNTVKNLSSSWGWSGGPDATTDNIFKQMAAQGQTYFNASGDSDAFPTGYVDNAGNITAPSSSPYIIQVGGTTLSTASVGGNYTSETVWNWGYYPQVSAYVGSSGGVSSYYSIPTWQMGINSFANNGGSSKQRNIPDVALTGDNVSVYYGNGSTTTVGGTSCAAPLWGGFMALVNEQAAANSQPPGGFINPALYELANQSTYNSTFHDVTMGNNVSTSSPNAFYAVPGYDLCTGLGTPNGTNFINALLNPDPLIVVSNFGFTAVGPSAGPFNISTQTFYLTNASASALTWSLINTSAWLNVSLGGDTLSSGAGEAVVVSLNGAGVSSLSVGNYTATLWFSNVTSSIGHSRLFTVTVNDSLALLPTNSFNFIGPVGGPFAPAVQAVVLTNISGTALNWSVGNSSSWFNVSTTNGSLNGGAQTTVNFTLTPAATNLIAGIYNVAIPVTNLTSGWVQWITNNLLVGQSLVFNGGFETGDFTSWTLVGTSGQANYVGTSFTDPTSGFTINPHSGSYVALLGEAGTNAYLSQLLPTLPGQKYLLSLWLCNALRGNRSNPNTFSVSWSGQSLYNKTNVAQLNWTNLQFVVTATTNNTVLQFGARNDNSYLGLDDVSVQLGLPPVIVTPPTNLVVFIGSNAVFSATVNSDMPVVYQWRKNGTNLVNGGSISGATTNILTLTAVTTNSAGNYTLFATNIFGVVTSSVANLTIVLPPNINGVVANPDGSVTLGLAGSPGVNYILQTSTNLLSIGGWQSVATNLMATNGIWLFNDPQTTNFLQRFYRLEYSP